MRVAHLSDLHLGLDARSDTAARELVASLVAEDVDLVLLTGDVTHKGRRAELERYREIFAPLESRLVAVPGNHDRLGDDLGDALMPGFRVQAGQHGSLWVVRFNSTGPHNRRWLDGHGLLTAADVEDVDRHLRAGPRGLTRVLMMHHHPLPLPDEHVMEKLVTRLGWPNARELSRGPELIDRLRFSCDVVLHGHRHVPAEIVPFAFDEPAMRIYSGGSSTGLRACRILSFGAGSVETRWLAAGAVPVRAPDEEPVGIAA